MSAGAGPRRSLTARKLSSEDRVVRTMKSTSSAGKRPRTQSTHARECSLTMTTSEAMPAAAKLPITRSIRGTPPTGTSALGTA